MADKQSMRATPDVQPVTLAGYLDPHDHVLLIEDSAFQADMLAGMLRTGGLDVEVHRAASLAEARLALEGGIRLSCIVLDLTLPDASGLEGVIEMCNRAHDVPIVVVTADDDEARAVKAVQLGAQDYLTKGRIDAHVLRRSLRYAIERKRSELQLARQALHDPLTGLPNRTLLDDRLQLALAHSARQESMVAVLFCDLDGFKKVNDEYGHGVGDRLLRTVAARLLSAVRGGDTVARYGGDEFTIVSTELSSDAEATQLALRLRTAVSLPVPMPGGDQVSVATSIGIALATGVAWRPTEVVEAADSAMYSAKRSGAPFELVRL